MASLVINEEDKLSGNTSKNSEEVLIERDGKFELVSASDMQADQPFPTENTEDRKVTEAASTHENADPEENIAIPSKEAVSDDESSKGGASTRNSSAKKSSSTKGSITNADPGESTASPSKEAVSDDKSSQGSLWKRGASTKADPSESTASPSKEAVSDDKSSKESLQKGSIKNSSIKGSPGESTIKEAVGDDKGSLWSSTNPGESTLKKTVSDDRGSLRSSIKGSADPGKSTLKKVVSDDRGSLRHSSNKNSSIKGSMKESVKKGSSKGVDGVQGEFSDSWCSLSASSCQEVVPSKHGSTSAAVQSIIDRRSRDLDIMEMPSKITTTSLENHPSSRDSKAVSESFISGTSPTGTWKSKGGIKSAPEYRNWEDAELDRNECAFRAWLARKDAQMAEQRKFERLTTRIPTREEHLQKIEQCKLAYQTWLERKTREIRLRKLEEHRIKSAATDNMKPHSMLSFQVWLEQKYQQRRREHQVAMRKTKEEEGIMLKVEPSVAQLAYQRWLQQKNFEARREAARRQELHRLYFRQGRRLKQSLRARFQGF